jgi:hypothetical protein
LEEDYPLEFEFSVSLDQYFENQLFLSSRDLPNSITTVLPFSNSEDNALYIGVKVYDAKGAYSTLTTSVNLLEITNPEENVINNVLELSGCLTAECIGLYSFHIYSIIKKYVISPETGSTAIQTMFASNTNN